MSRMRRIGGAMVLAGTLASGFVTATPAAAAPGPTAARVTLADFCEGLSDAIVFLEGRPPSRLRDFLLDRARDLFERYCS